MPDTLPPCPECGSAFAYDDGSGLLNCPECGHAWTPEITVEKVWRDSNGTVLQDGDSVTVIKDLKIKGTNNVVKVGTKVKGIKLVDSDHDIDCKVPGVGQMGLKTEFVKKITD